jgi:transcriptional regulator with XRE-family HTH domain
MSTSGERVRLARERYNLTQAEFADRLSVKQSYLSYIEHDKRPPSEKILKKMYLSYKINAEWILYGTGAMIDGEIPEIKHLPPSKGLSDFDVLKTIIMTIEECANVTNRQLDPSTKAGMIINFYQYFYDATDSIGAKEIKKRIELSFDVVANMVRRQQ